MSENDDDRDADRVGYELAKHGEAMAGRRRLRRWAYQGHKDGRDHLWMADMFDLQLQERERGEPAGQSRRSSAAVPAREAPHQL